MWCDTISIYNPDSILGNSNESLTENTKENK